MSHTFKEQNMENIEISVEVDRISSSDSRLEETSDIYR